MWYSARPAGISWVIAEHDAILILAYPASPSR